MMTGLSSAYPSVTVTSPLTAKPLPEAVRRMQPEVAGKRNLGPFELVERIGRGGSSVVYRARSSEGKTVAIKALLPSAAASENRLVRFYQEARAMMRIVHPNVIQAYEVAEDGGRHYMTMEYVDGETLSDRVKRQGRLSERTALKIAICLARALCEAHKRGILHRDVSPKNVMISVKGETKLGDFELAKQSEMDLDMTMEGKGMGTPDFMSPEQFHRAKDLDERSDVYSLGVTLYYMVTGRLPFAGGTCLEKWMAKAKNEYQLPRMSCPSLSDRTNLLIRRAMAARPDDRPATASQFAAYAMNCLKSLDKPPAPRNDASRRKGRWQVVFVHQSGRVRKFSATRREILNLIDDGQLGADARASYEGNEPYRRLEEIRTFQWAFGETRSSDGPTGPRLGLGRFRRWLQTVAVVLGWGGR